MPCQPETARGVRKAEDCKCYKAVMRTYSAMLESQCPEPVAQEAALRVYRFHHPEDAAQHASITVESWLHAGHMH